MLKNFEPGIYNPIMGVLKPTDPNQITQVRQGLPVQEIKQPPTFDINNPPVYVPTSQTVELGTRSKRNKTTD